MEELHFFPLAPILSQVEEEDLDPLRPLVPQLLQQFLTLSNEVG